MSVRVLLRGGEVRMQRRRRVASSLNKRDLPGMPERQSKVRIRAGFCIKGGYDSRQASRSKLSNYKGRYEG